jgi:hypothetical protein
MDSCPIVQVTDPPKGLIEFRIRDSRGVRIALLQVDSACIDDELMQDLHDWQARHAHERAELKVMPASPSAGSKGAVRVP